MSLYRVLYQIKLKDSFVIPNSFTLYPEYNFRNTHFHIKFLHHVSSFIFRFDYLIFSFISVPLNLKTLIFLLKYDIKVEIYNQHDYYLTNFAENISSHPLIQNMTIIDRLLITYNNMLIF